MAILTNTDICPDSKIEISRTYKNGSLIGIRCLKYLDDICLESNNNCFYQTFIDLPKP